MRGNEIRKVAPPHVKRRSSTRAIILFSIHVALVSIFIYYFAFSFVPQFGQLNLRQRVHPFVPRNFSVYDAVMYNGESHLFYLRVRTLDPFVDRFIVGYACRTFQNHLAPPFSYAPLERELDEYADKIMIFRTWPPSAPMRASERELRLRRFLQLSVKSLMPSPDDLIINCDCDEIPTQTAMKWILDHPPKQFYKFKGVYFWYTFKWYVRDEIGRKSFIWRWSAVKSLQNMRQLNRRRTPDISLVHCSYCLPDLASIVRKLETFRRSQFAAEPFINPSYILACVECGRAVIPDQAHRIVPYPGDVNEFVPFDHPATDFLKKTIGFSDIAITSPQNVSHFKKLINCTKK